MSAPLHFDDFLSSSSKDRLEVREVAEQLLKDGMRVWFDEWMLKSGLTTHQCTQFDQRYSLI